MGGIILLIIILVFGLIKFLSAFEKDNTDLQSQKLSDKFAVMIGLINQNAFSGSGKITIVDKRLIQLYKNGENQIIQFEYSTGHLAIVWKYKYYQKEVAHEELFKNVRNLSILEQKRIAETMIKIMNRVIAKHKINVLHP